MDRNIVINNFNAAIRFFLYLLVFWLPYSSAVIESSAIIASLLWIVKRGYCLGPKNLSSIKFRQKIKEIIVAFKPKENLLNGPIAFFLVACIFSVVGSPLFEWSLSGFLTKTFEWFVIYFLVIEVFTEPRYIRMAFLIFAITTFATCLDGIIQFHITHKDIFFGYQLNGGGATAGFKTYNNLGGYLTFVIPLVFSQILLGHGKKSVRFLLVTMAVAALWVTIVTFSRGAWFSILCGVLLTLFLLKRKSFLPIFLILLTASIFYFSVFSSSNTKKAFRLDSRNIIETANWRLSVWKDSLKMIQDKPVFGHGINTYMNVFAVYQKRIDFSPTYAHNCYIQLAAETGMLGLICFLWIMIRLFRKVVKKINETASTHHQIKTLLAGLLGGVLAFLIHSFLDTNLYSLKLSTVFWLMIGFLGAVYNLSEKKEMRAQELIY